MRSSLAIAICALLGACSGHRPREPGWSERPAAPNLTPVEAEVAEIRAGSRRARGEFTDPICAVYFDEIDACVARLEEDDLEALDEELYDNRYAWKELIAEPRSRPLIPVVCGLASRAFRKRYSCP